MKVVFFNESLGVYGGGEILALEEMRCFNKKGAHARMLTFALNPDARRDYPELDIEVLGGKTKFQKVLALRKRLRELDPDAIFPQSYWDCAYIYLAMLFTGKDYLANIHGTIFWLNDPAVYALVHRKVFKEVRGSNFGNREFVAEKQPKMALLGRLRLELQELLVYLAVRKATHVITLTERQKWELKKLYGVDATVSRGCLNPKLFTYKAKKDFRKRLGLQDKRVILSLGRLDPRKRVHVLIEAFSMIHKKYDDVVLAIAGKGPEDGRLRKLSADLGLADKVIFLGFVPEEDKLDVYAMCDIFAFPSWTTSGITTYEALALGKKVVWTSEADEPVLTEKQVFVADPTAEAFAAAIEKALNTKIMGKLNLSDYTWDKYSEKAYEIILKHVSRGKRSQAS